MIDVTTVIGLSFMFMVLHVLFKEVALYHRNVLTLVGLYMAIACDILSLMAFTVDMVLTYYMLGLSTVVCAIATACLKRWTKYLTFVKLACVIYEPLMLIPITLFYAVSIGAVEHCKFRYWNFT